MHVWKQNQFKPTRGRDEPIKHPSMRAVQTDPIDRSTIRSEDLKGDWTEDRSDVDTNSKDWALERINRSRSDPSFGLPKWYERMKTGDHPKLVTIREPQPSEDDCCSETAAFKGGRMPVHEGKPSCPTIPMYRAPLRMS
jgi:hypothetical protein